MEVQIVSSYTVVYIPSANDIFVLLARPVDVYLFFQLKNVEEETGKWITEFLFLVS